MSFFLSKILYNKSTLTYKILFFMQTKKAFTLIEMIIVVSILALLAVVGMSYQWAQNQKVQNTKTVWDLGTLNNSIASYLEEKWTLPDPKWNKNYFLSGSQYAHDETTAFWVHWFVTQNLLPKKYLNYLPLDPRTNQYYAYWKTIDNKYYEVAWVLNVEWDYITKLQWNYPGDNWPYSLIREYNWPNFISDKSKQSFPYNPEERILVWKINTYSWSVTITWDWYMISWAQILNHTLVEWDTITVSDWGSATIFFSDWSQSVLWESWQESKLTLASMEFKSEDNLLTNIQLALDSGTLWTKATNLNSDGSDFEVYTTDIAAAVRWTIFWIQKNKSSNETILTVKQWTVEIKKIKKENAWAPTPIDNIAELVISIKENKINKENIIIDDNTVINEWWHSLIKVIDPSTSKTIKKEYNIDTINLTIPELPEIEAEAFTTNVNLKIDTKIDTLKTVQEEEDKILKEVEVKSVYWELYAFADFNDWENLKMKVINWNDIIPASSLSTVVGELASVATAVVGELVSVDWWSDTDDTDNTVWVLIDNDWNHDFIEYSGLDLWNKFTIVMNAKLNWTWTWARYLFNANWNKLYITYNDDERVYELRYKKENSSVTKEITLNDNYYEITAKFNRDYTENNINIDGNTIELEIKDFNSINNIYIGSKDEDTSKQLNNVINYIKIYTN